LPERVRRANVVLPNGVDTATFRPLRRDDARADLGWKGDELVALFGATKPWIPRKRHRLAALACEEAARRRGRPIRLEVVADVPPERMPVLLNAADCLLMTSSIEGSPNIVKEALMCNLPVVATRAGDVELLLQGVTPSYVCDADPDSLATALVDCLTARGRSDGRAVASWLADDVIAARLIEVFRKLAPIDVSPAPDRSAAQPAGVVPS
jgi:glycosyltransferase involved in cell wall biosynthesis